MNCSSCGKVNKPAAKFCKFCGSPISANYKTCVNGHNYDATLAGCPYCPKPAATNTTQDNMTSAKTVLDTPEIGPEKTTLDTKTAQPETPAKSESKVEQDKIIKTSKPPVTMTGGEIPDEKIKKLAGWLVTFDLNPEGTDFKLANGTFVNGNKIDSRIELKDNDEIKVGKTSFKIKII